MDEYELRRFIDECVSESVARGIDADVRPLMTQVAEQAVHQTLEGLGIDIHDSKQAQADMLYLRKLRIGSEFVSTRVITSMVTVLVGSTLWLLWQAIKESLRQ